MQYCLIAGIYLISLSRVPREYLPQPVGFSVHFGLRFLLEIFLLRFVMAFFDDRRRLNAFVQGGLALGSILCSLMGFNNWTGHSWVTFFSIWGSLLFPYTTLLGFYLAVKGSHDKSLSNQGIIPLFFFLFVMQVWDILALRGILPDIYFGRFSPLIIGIFFGYAFWQKAAEERQKIEVDAKVGVLTAQVAHDIRSPLAALEMSLEDLSALPEDIRLIVRSAVGRIHDISNNLINNYQVPLAKKELIEQKTPVQPVSDDHTESVIYFV